MSAQRIKYMVRRYVLKLEMPKSVFWYRDGTVADSYGFLNDAHNYTLEQLGFAPLKDGEYRA